MTFLRIRSLPIAVALLASLSLPAAAMECEGNKCVCFTKRGEDCAAIAAAQIAAAKSTVDIQAYSFTEPRIAQALEEAVFRGVKIRAIFDKTDPNERGEKASEVAASGVTSAVDYDVAIAHNKVIVIDGKTCLGGSFNYTVSANEKNAENMTVIYDDPTWAAFYEDNFAFRLQQSRPYTGGGK